MSTTIAMLVKAGATAQTVARTIKMLEPEASAAQLIISGQGAMPPEMFLEFTIEMLKESRPTPTTPPTTPPPTPPTAPPPTPPTAPPPTPPPSVIVPRRSNNGYAEDGAKILTINNVKNIEVISQVIYSLQPGDYCHMDRDALKRLELTLRAAAGVHIAYSRKRKVYVVRWVNETYHIHMCGRFCERKKLTKVNSATGAVTGMYYAAIVRLS